MRKKSKSTQQILTNHQLVNNAGYGLTGDTESSLPSSPEEHAKARKVMETNFWGVANLTLHAMRIMREDNAASGGLQGGVILQITSMGGFMGFPGNAYYHAAKFAVEGFTESVSREVRPEWNSRFWLWSWMQRATERLAG